MTVLELARKELILDKKVTAVIGVVSFIILMACSAFIRVPLPFTPVPLTLQTFAVLLTGAVLGKKLGSISQAGYIGLGAAGLPIFSGAGFGLAYLMGPTGGYLVGFITAAWVIGQIIGDKKSGFFKILFAMFIGEIILFSLGVTWLSISLHFGIVKALTLGLLPFVIGDVIKLLAAATLYYEIQGRVREIYPK